MMPDVAGSPVPVLLVWQLSHDRRDEPPANMTPTPKADVVPLGAGHTHDLMLEWTTKDPKAAADAGGAALELFRIAHLSDRR
jgi:hypothetical protein